MKQTSAAELKTGLHRARLAIVMYFLIVCGLCAFAVPVGQGPDETAHLTYVNFVTSRNQLPNQYVPDRFVDWEGHQPPLYYMVASILLRVVNGGEACRLEGRPDSAREWTPIAFHLKDGWEHWDIRFIGARDKSAFYALRFFPCCSGLALCC